LEITKLISTENIKIEEMNNFLEQKNDQFFKYFKYLLKNDKQTYIQNKIKITYKNGIQHLWNWDKTWHELSYNNCDIEDKEIIFNALQNMCNEEGQKILNAIKKIDTHINIKDKRINVGTIQPYHKEYFYLPSYAENRTEYPINLIFKLKYNRLIFKIPAFYRNTIVGDWVGSDAGALKRNMLLIEYYDDIIKNLKEIQTEIQRQYKIFLEKKIKINKMVSKYEILMNI